MFEMYAASLDSDCFPLPPTPMRSAFPRGHWGVKVRNIQYIKELTSRILFILQT